MALLAYNKISNVYLKLRVKTKGTTNEINKSNKSMVCREHRYGLAFKIIIIVKNSFLQ